MTNNWACLVSVIQHYHVEKSGGLGMGGWKVTLCWDMTCSRPVLKRAWGFWKALPHRLVSVPSKSFKCVSVPPVSCISELSAALDGRCVVLAQHGTTHSLAIGTSVWSSWYWVWACGLCARLAVDRAVVVTVRVRPRLPWVGVGGQRWRRAMWVFLRAEWGRLLLLTLDINHLCLLPVHVHVVLRQLHLRHLLTLVFSQSLQNFPI